ncbi:MAG TPA: type II toxin-antitoxin system prevent-host-death family antitoxin [Candidatus Dormibacteraeota bacterium]|nr:type II toxin-antitoxin system prevent-host-death family antitoxin [Candidatus Dormibacteraeota bacterium]
MTIGIREAKAQLSRLVSEAERGTEWIITDRGRPVARLAPLNDLASPLEHRLSKLAKWGWIDSRVRPDTPIPPAVKIGADAQKALQDDRDA